MAVLVCWVATVQSPSQPLSILPCSAATLFVLAVSAWKGWILGAYPWAFLIWTTSKLLGAALYAWNHCLCHHPFITRCS